MAQKRVHSDPVGEAAADAPPLKLPARGSPGWKACERLAFLCLKFASSVLKELPAEERAELQELIKVVGEFAPEFVTCIAAWIRDKQEFGNRVIPAAIIAVAAWIR
eukprot:Hpha_TRINITY_DN16124_c3_g3::TRINITY_DN16124_c3_g3_i1::g.3269::m.3269